MALMITDAVVFAVGAFFGAVMVAVGEQLDRNRHLRRRWRRTAYTVGVSGRKGKLALHAWQQGKAVFETCFGGSRAAVPRHFGK